GPKDSARAKAALAKPASEPTLYDIARSENGPCSGATRPPRIRRGNVTPVTAAQRSLAAHCLLSDGTLPGSSPHIEEGISRICKGLSGNGPALLPERPLRAKGVVVAVPQKQRISGAPSRPFP